MAATYKSKRQRLERDFSNGDISVSDYINAMWEEKCRSTDQWREDHLRMHSLEKRALDEAKKVTDKELEHLNQLRQDVLTDRARFLLKETFETFVMLVNEKFSSVSTKLAYYAGAFVVITFLLWAIVVLHQPILDLLGK